MRRADRVVTKVLQRLAARMWGFEPHLMPHIVRLHGPFFATRWLLLNMPRYDRTLHRWGPLRTNLTSM